MSEPMIAASSASTNNAKNSVVFSNRTSCQRAEASRRSGGLGSRRATRALWADVKIFAVEAVADMIYVQTTNRPGSYFPGRACLRRASRPLLVPDRLARGVLDLRFPADLDLRDQRGGQRDVVELFGHLLA